MADSVLAINQEQAARFVKEIRTAEDKMAEAAKLARGIAGEPISRWGEESGPKNFHTLFVAEMNHIEGEYQKLAADFKRFAELVNEAATRTLDADAEAELAVKLQQVTLEMDKPKAKPATDLGFDFETGDRPQRGHLRMEAE